MKSTVLALFLTLFLGLVSVFVVPSAYACVPFDEDILRCDRLRQPKVPAAVAAVAPKQAVVAAPAPTKKGTSPSDAMTIGDTWQTIGPGTSVWYQIGEGIDRVHLDVWLDAWGKDGIEFAVFSQDQMNDWSSSTPAKGRGTRNRLDNTHDLNWSGQAPAGGTWYVQVINNNSAPVPFKIGYNRVVTGPRNNCTGPYTEYLGALGHDVVWPGYCP